MHVPPISFLGYFGTRKNNNVKAQSYSNLVPNLIKPIGDTVSFKGISKEMRQYASLPEEIQKIISPRDAIAMFKDMSYEAEKARNQDNSFVPNPYLNGYYVYFSHNKDNTKKASQLSQQGYDCVWNDPEGNNYSLYKKSA